MTRNLDRDTPVRRIANNQTAIRNEERKPVLGGSLIYVGDFVGPDDPANDPPDASPDSPPWENGFTYLAGSPVWFAHGVDGETDMGGMYDLITGSPVSGTVAFTMPLEWATEAPPLHVFAVLIEEGASDDLDIFAVALQRIDSSTGEVRIYWPICADLCVT